MKVTNEQFRRLAALSLALGNAQNVITRILTDGFDVSLKGTPIENREALEVELGHIRAIEAILIVERIVREPRIAGSDDWFTKRIQETDALARAAAKAEAAQHHREHKFQGAEAVPEGCKACRHINPATAEIGERCVVCQREFIAGSTEL